MKPWLKKQWCLPTGPDAEFVARMEGLLDLFQEPYDPQSPWVCMDEVLKQLVADKRPVLPVAPRQPQRYDYEYRRCGTANVFLFCEPLRGWREVKVTQRRTKVDWAHAVRELLEVHYPQARKLRLVLDNLNTHKPGSLYEAFAPEEARRLWKRLEFHYTPKHASWLNMAEIELSVMARQCLRRRRIPSQEQLARELATWASRRNAAARVIDWHFTTVDARIKLKRLYPKIQT